ncbi:MAG: helix-hairpin-helix domain-containing protein [Prevotellaceae bacterium]|jgi:DNA uptake protein ComE-like DNA-binding protein|nr:helix-hairpin-helix domain-containing protein [Prevotellaceae bacterium]
MKKFFFIFLRFSRNEQLGLVLLFILVLTVLLAPQFFSPPAAGAFHYDSIIRRIDSLTIPSDPPSSFLTRAGVTRQTRTSPTPKTANIPSAQQTYTPFTRDNLSKPVIELNTADTTALRLVRGIGAYFARSIVTYRERLGGYAHIQQLLDLRGIDPERLAQWTPQLTLDTTKIVKIYLATADEQILRQHPYIGYYAARGIVHFRTTQGAQACTLRALVENNILNDDAAQRLKPYCEP